MKIYLRGSEVSFPAARSASPAPAQAPPSPGDAKEDREGNVTGKVIYKKRKIDRKIVSDSEKWSVRRRRRLIES